MAHQRQADALDAPEAVTTLMGAIRLFAPLIDARRARGFTDPQIASMLAAHGVDITVETLRVYRARLRREAAAREGDPRTAPIAAAPSVAPGPDQRTAHPPPRAAESRDPAISPPLDSDFTKMIALDDSV